MPAAELMRSERISSGRSGFGLAILSLINFFNYLDRYIRAGVSPLVEKVLGIDHAEAGLLGSVFMVVYMIASPFGGYLGDRMPRRLLVAGGVFLRSLATIGSGLASTFAMLLIARAIIGIGQARYGTAPPAPISCPLSTDLRSRRPPSCYIA